MLKQRQPNNWSCLPTAFAIVLNKPVEEFIGYIGHDGSEITRLDLKEPECRKGFHIQECIKITLDYAIGVIHLDRYPRIHKSEYLFHIFGDDTEYIESLMKYYNGVLLGKSFAKPHAVAWNQESQLIIDPKNAETYDKEHFYIETFLMFRSLVR